MSGGGRDDPGGGGSHLRAGVFGVQQGRLVPGRGQFKSGDASIGPAALGEGRRQVLARRRQLHFFIVFLQDQAVILLARHQRPIEQPTGFAGLALGAAQLQRRRGLRPPGARRLGPLVQAAISRRCLAGLQERYLEGGPPLSQIRGVESGQELALGHMIAVGETDRADRALERRGDVDGVAGGHGADHGQGDGERRASIFWLCSAPAVSP